MKPFQASALFTLFVFLFCAAVPARADSVVTGIRIEGNQRVENSTIERNLALGVGDTYNDTLATLSLRKLYGLGVFSRVSIQEEPSEKGVLLVVKVKEYPMVQRIDFVGRKSVDEAELRKVLKVKAFSFADPAKLKGDIKALEDVYSTAGYRGTEITEDLKDTDKGVVITYRIKEAKKSLIREVDIIGNRHLDDRAIKKVMLNKEIGPVTVFSEAGGYDASAANDDIMRIQYLYMENGYLDVKVHKPEVSPHPDGNGLYVAVRVEEGPQYTLGGVRFTGDWQAPPNILRREPDVKVGDVFARSKVMGDLNMYEDSYRDLGYAWCHIEPLFERQPEKGKVVLNLVLTKGPLVHIRWINISGNSKTRDYVIRREMRTVEGDLYDQKKLDDSRRFIRRLGFFKTVNITPIKVGDTTADIDVKVEEGPAGSLSAGLSYSSVEGIIGQIQLSQGNYAGRGQRLNLTMEVGGVSSSYSLSFSEPRLFSGVFSFGLDLFRKTNEYSQYTQDSNGGSVKLGYRLTDRSSVSGRYRNVTYDVYHIDLGASNLIKEQEGVSKTSSLRIGYDYDTRDIPQDPSEGMRLAVSAEVAGGVLGGTNDFMRYQVEGSFFTPLIGDLIGSAHLKAGLVSPMGNGEIPVTERYFMGGLYTLRGFQYRMVGPLENGDPIGGTKSFLMNLEAAYPIIKDANVKGVLFLDSGNVWASDEKVSAGDLRYGAGFGFRWAAPIGLLRLEWGFNLNPKPDEIQPGWEFSIGTLF